MSEENITIEVQLPDPNRPGEFASELFFTETSAREYLSQWGISGESALAFMRFFETEETFLQEDD